MQLIGFDPHGHWRATRFFRPGPRERRAGPLSLPARGDDRECTADHLRHAAELAVRIPQDAVVAPAKQLSVALHRFHLGCAETPADALIDFCIALEAIFLQNKNSELSYRFKLFGSYYLEPNDQVRRRELFKQLGEIYAARSTLVHGGTPTSMHTLKDTAKLARALASQALRKVLVEGWPAEDTLSDAVLR